MSSPIKHPWAAPDGKWRVCTWTLRANGCGHEYAKAAELDSREEAIELAKKLAEPGRVQTAVIDDKSKEIFVAGAPAYPHPISVTRLAGLEEKKPYRSYGRRR